LTFLLWWLLTKEQRLALLMDEACALQSRKAENLTLKASGDWYQTCLQAIRQGSNAMKENMRWSTRKKQVSDYLQTARTNLIPKGSKVEVDTITNKLFESIDVDEYAENSDF